MCGVAIHLKTYFTFSPKSVKMCIPGLGPNPGGPTGPKNCACAKDPNISKTATDNTAVFILRATENKVTAKLET